MKRSTHRAVLLAGLASGLTLLALAAILGWREYRSERDQWLDRAAADARVQADHAQTLVSSRLRLLDTAAGSPAFRSAQRRSMMDYLTRLQRDGELGFTAGMGWIDTRGRLRVVAPAALRRAGAVDLSDRDYVNAVLETGRPFVSRVLVNRLESEIPIIVLAVPTGSGNGRLTGVLAGAIRLDRPGAFQRELVRSADKQTFVVDRAGRLVIGQRPIRALTSPQNSALADRARRAGQGSLAGVDGLEGTRSRLVGFAEVPAADWLVVTEQSMAATIGRAERRFALELLALVFIAAIGFTVALWLSQRLHRARRNDERQAQRWQAATLALSSAATVDDIRWVVFDHIRGSLGGDGGFLALPDRGEVVVHVSYTRTGGPTSMRLAADMSHPATDVLTTEEPVAVRRAADLSRRFPEAGPLIAAEGVRSLASVPVSGSTGQVRGALGVVFRDERTLAPAELTFLESLATQCGLALERAQLYEWERRARRRAETLQELTSRLAAARSERAAAHALLEGAGSVLDADAGIVTRLSDDGKRLTPVAAVGLGDGGDLTMLPVDGSNPDAEALREAGVVNLVSRDELAERYPEAQRTAEEWPFEGSATVAMVAGDRAIGTLSLMWRGERELDVDERLFLRTLGLQCAQAVERSRLYENERHERHEAERSRRQAALLAEIGATLDSTRTSKARLRRLVAALVPELADLAVAQLRGSVEQPALAAVADRDAEAALARRELYELDALGEKARRAIARVLETGEAVLLEQLEPELIEEQMTGEEATALLQRIKPRSAVIVPLLARAEVIGALVLAAGRSGRLYGSGDLAFAREIGARAGLAIENALLYEREHRIAFELQQSLLAGSQVTDDRVEICAAYSAGQEELEVGGDWHDSIMLPGGRIGLVVGDIVGRGIPAAAAMGQLRSALAALAPVCEGPADALRQLSLSTARIQGAHLATIAYAVLDPDSGLLRYASAGHPPPLVVPAEGEPAFLWEGRSAPLGALPAGAERDESETTLGPGDTLLLYSDGLVERRGESLDAGLERLRLAVSERRHWGVATLCNDLVVTMRKDVEVSDDVALLVIRLLALPVQALHLDVPAAPEQLASIRSSLRSWLAEAGVDPRDTAELVLAAGEACANAVEHAYASDGNEGDVELDAHFVSGDEIVVEVRDRGRWRTDGSSPDRGRGLAIIRALTGYLDVAHEERGTTVRMRRSVTRGVAA